MEGLERVIQIRGGYETLENDMMLSRLLFWYETLCLLTNHVSRCVFATLHCTYTKLSHSVDISGASRQDLKPRFPHPTKMLQGIQESETSTPLNPSLQPRKQWFNPSHVLTSIFDDLNAAIQHTESRSAQNQTWRQVTFIIHWIDPVLHRLLNINSNVRRNGSASVIQEACRLGIILFLAEVRRKCGVMCVTTTVYISKLKDLLLKTDDRVDWTQFSLLRLWLLFFGMVESGQQPEADWYADSVCKVAERLQLAPWDGIVTAVKSVLWFEDIFESKIEQFRGVIMSRLFFPEREIDSE